LSMGIIAATLFLDPVHAQSMSVLILLWVPIAATIIESVAVYGTDNILVPLLVVVSLNTLRSIG
jgi:dolichol kinase